MQEPKGISGSAALDIRLLGPFEARVHGRPLSRLRTRKGEWLLALLALRHDRDTERAWLAGTLWPDSDSWGALSNLRRSLTDLRRALGPEAARLLSPTPHTLRLDLSGANCDLITFDAAIQHKDEGVRMKDEEDVSPLHPFILSDRRSRSIAGRCWKAVTKRGRCRSASSGRNSTCTRWRRWPPMPPRAEIGRKPSAIFAASSPSTRCAKPRSRRFCGYRLRPEMSPARNGPTGNIAFCFIAS